MTDLQIFEDALAEVCRLAESYPESRAIVSIIDQLRYVIDVETGANFDRSLLVKINIGVLTAREIEDLDLGVAKKLYAVSAIIKSKN